MSMKRPDCRDLFWLAWVAWVVGATALCAGCAHGPMPVCASVAPMECHVAYPTCATVQFVGNF